MANIVRRDVERGELAPARREWDPFRMMRELLRWDPFAEMAPYAPIERGYGFVPAFDVKETRDAYVFKADLPGVREQELELSVTGNRLTVGGKREEERREEEATYFAYERSYGVFSRTFTLPESADVDNLKADLRSGVLTITVPKRPEMQPRKIEVKSEPPQPKAKA